MIGLRYIVAVVILVISLFISFFINQSLRTAAVIESQEMAQTGILLVTNLARVQNAMKQVAKYVNKTLYIKLNNVTEQSLLSKHIAAIYYKASYLCGNLDVRLLLQPSSIIRTSNPVEVVLCEKSYSANQKQLEETFVNLANDYQLKLLDIAEPVAETSTTEKESAKMYQYVAVGGTFDRLHNGHKILLSEAAVRTSTQLTVGVTDVNMIQSKTLWELIEPVQKRMDSVRDFLTDVNPDIELDLVAIQDPYGPVKDDPKFQMIVVSEETIRGGVMINEKRDENKLSLLDIHTVSLAQEAQTAEHEEHKISSSNGRMRLLGTLLKPPQPNPEIPDWPYVIGLAGGIASGKTSIADRLKAKGAGVVNCDTLGHELYKPGLPLNHTIAETFGAEVISPSGDVDRAKLGQLVFSDQEKMEKLNSVMWPAILEEARRRVQALGRAGHRVVVMEAAVMVRAGWDRYCHQLWAVIVPPQEAIKRLMDRNQLSEEQARARLHAQPSNSEQVSRAHVVLSPQWSRQHTRRQLDTAWEHVQAALAARASQAQ